MHAMTEPGTITASPPARSSSLALATTTLWRREMTRFFRQRNRVIGALLTPVVFWLVLGGGLNGAFVFPGPADGGEVGYLEYFYPGTVVMILLFTTIFSAYSVIEDRVAGFLQGVRVAPAPRVAIVLGKVLGGACIGWMQAVLFLLVWPFVTSGELSVLHLAGAVGVMFIVAIALTAIGFCLAWPMESTAGFHAVLNLVLFPIWFLSGALYPYESAAGWQKVAMLINPLTYGQSAFSALLRGPGAAVAGGPVASIALNVLITVAFAVVMIGFAALMVARPRKDGGA